MMSARIALCAGYLGLALFASTVASLARLEAAKSAETVDGVVS